MLKNAAILLLIMSFTFTGCDNYNRLLKSNDIGKKYQAAKEYYNDGDYYKAVGLLEELISIYRGRPELEEIYYYYCYCHYGQENYLLAAHNFKNFTSYFPNSDKARDCQYMVAYCYYKVSPRAELDQTQTKKAIEAFQLFINKYPNSEKVDLATAKIDDLRAKLEEKAFESARLYYDMENYKAAKVAFENVLVEYPDTEKAEDIFYLIVRSNYLLARNSILSKQRQRYQDVIESYEEFEERYPGSRYLKDAKALYLASKKAIEE